MMGSNPWPPTFGLLGRRSPHDPQGDNDLKIPAIMRLAVKIPEPAAKIINSPRGKKNLPI
jgi:hypothetical protein